MQTCTEHEKFESLDSYVSSWGQTGLNSAFLFQLSCTDDQKNGDGMGQCSVVSARSSGSRAVGQGVKNSSGAS